MSKKRISAESNNDEQPNEGSDSLSQQGDNAKRAKLASFSDTTLQDLPMELLECILVRVVAMEVKGMKLAKSVWKEKADLVISRLQTVCSQWSTVLTTNFFRNEVTRTLDRTAQETIRLEILHQFPIPFCVFRVTATEDEMFMLCRVNDCYTQVIVYNRNTMTEVKDAIALVPRTHLTDVAACHLSNCVYVLGLSKECLSMLRITKDEGGQFNISPWLSDLSLPFSTISVSANGSLIILSGSQEAADLSIYDANGSLQHKIMLSPDILGFILWDNVIQKSNGNHVLVSFNDQLELTEVDATGAIERQYKSSIRINVGSGVNFADSYGRVMISETGNKIKLLDSELNALEFTGPHLNGRLLHYNCARNEVASILSVGPDKSVLTIFRFTEE